VRNEDTAPRIPPPRSSHNATTQTASSVAEASSGNDPQVAADKTVIAALDARLPRWEGPLSVLYPPSVEGISGSGWWGEGSSGSVPTNARMRAVMETVDQYKHDEYRLAKVFDPIPPVTNIPYLSFDGPVTFSLIKTNITAGRYRTLRDVDIDMSRLFEKARRFYAEGTEDYGRVLILQRLYNALTAPYPLVVSGIPEQSPTLFASLPAGPGNARSLHETTQELRAGAAEQDVGFGITTFRVGTKDRIFTQEARHKGMAFRLGKSRRLMSSCQAISFTSSIPTMQQNRLSARSSKRSSLPKGIEHITSQYVGTTGQSKPYTLQTGHSLTAKYSRRVICAIIQWKIFSNG
jgi:chromatin structure-remodeling complex subunit RSC1/2